MGPPGADRYFDPNVETMARRDIDALQRDKLLGEVLPWSAERSPLIREAWSAAGITAADVRTLDDFFEKVPFLDKDAIRRFRDERGDPYGGQLCLAPDHEVFRAVFSTSGTTGDPTPMPYAGRGPSILTRDFWELGARPGDHFVEMLFTYRGPNVHETIRGVGATPVFLDHDPADVPALVRASLELRPTAWYTVSGILLLALEEALPRLRVDPTDVFASYRGVVHAGEPLSPRLRRLAEDWGLELFDHTGVGDVGAAFECREHDGLHFWEDMCFVEVLDPDGDQPVPDGEVGELVTTTLVNLAAPLVRYRSDDLVRVTRERCGCGRTHGRLWPLGRKGDEVVVGGRSVLPVDVWEAVESLPETSHGLFQVVRPRREVDVLRLRVGCSRETSGLAGRVADAVAAALGLDDGLVEVELVPNADLLRQGPPHKIPRVVRSGDVRAHMRVPEHRQNGGGEGAT